MTRLLLAALFFVSFIAEIYIIAIGLFLWLLFAYAGFEVVLIGFVLDGYYGVPSGVPLYTIMTMVAWSGALIVRRWLIVYDHTHASIS